jgi:hypothetical protein
LSTVQGLPSSQSISEKIWQKPSLHTLVCAQASPDKQLLPLGTGV